MMMITTEAKHSLSSISKAPGGSFSWKSYGGVTDSVVVYFIVRLSRFPGAPRVKPPSLGLGEILPKLISLPHANG